MFKKVKKIEFKWFNLKILINKYYHGFAYYIFPSKSIVSKSVNESELFFVFQHLEQIGLSGMNVQRYTLFVDWQLDIHLIQMTSEL